MRWISAVLFLWMPLLFSQSSLATNDIQPQVCNPDGASMKCVTYAKEMRSGSRNDWSPWYTLTSTAPKGYTFRLAVAHVKGLGAGNAHRCGVTSDKSPISQDGPTKGYKSGTAYWAQCYIAEEDAAHVVVKFNIQGTEDSGSEVSAQRPYEIIADAELIVFYDPAPTPAK